MNEKMDAEMSRKEEMHAEMMDCMKEMAAKEMPEMPEIPEVVFPEVQNVKVLNFPEPKAPIVKVEAPQPVVVPAPEVNIPEVKFPDVQKVEVINKDEPQELDYEKIGKEIGKNIKVPGGGGGGLGAFSTYGAATNAKLDEVISALGGGAEDVLSASSGGYDYYGYAPVGTATSAAGWQICRYDSSGNKRFADATSTYSKVWDSRATYTYLN